MKKIFTLLAAILMIAAISPQTPDKMSYQAVIRDTEGNLVTDQEIGMQISILQGSADGTVVYTETQTSLTNENGLVSIEIGGEAGFAEIDWSDGPYLIKTETDPLGGTTYTITGTSQLLSVPYALHARTVEEINIITYEIGDFAHGGVVFYVEPCGTKGLVAAINDRNGGAGIDWSSFNYLTLAKRNGIYAGKENTSTILAASIANNDVDLHAAGVCACYKGVNYGDWYLPSLEELYLIHINREAINKTAVESGGSVFSGNNYWSSTEISEDRAWRLNITTGDPVSTVKLPVVQPRVRAVRAF